MILFKNGKKLSENIGENDVWGFNEFHFQINKDQSPLIYCGENTCVYEMEIFSNKQYRIDHMHPDQNSVVWLNQSCEDNPSCYKIINSVNNKAEYIALDICPWTGEIDSFLYTKERDIYIVVYGVASFVDPLSLLEKGVYRKLLAYLAEQILIKGKND